MEEFIIYCDESLERGKHFSNFYGGALVRSGDIDHVRESLAQTKASLNLHGEVKWNKITENYEEKYCQLIKVLFEFIRLDKIKIRVMFTQNYFVPSNLNPEQKENEYFLLYYQFIKHAFGLRHYDGGSEKKVLRIYFDKLPDTNEKVEKFKGYIHGLSRNPQIRNAGFVLNYDNITDVKSHEHDILQCLDIVLGSMQFRLNDLHLKKPRGSRFRGKRTRAKERVYKAINREICNIRPRFNIGISTGVDGDYSNRWRHSYRHWLFKQANATPAPGFGKRK